MVDNEEEEEERKRYKQNLRLQQSELNDELIFSESQKNALDTADDRRSGWNHQNPGKVVIKDSNDIHVGTHIKGDNITIKHLGTKNITIFQHVQPTKDGLQSFTKINDALIKDGKPAQTEINRNDSKCFKLNLRAIIIICIVASLVALVSSIVVTFLLSPTEQNDENKTTTTPTTTTPIPPTDWYVDVSQWSNLSTPINANYMKMTKNVLAVDQTDGDNCNNKIKCILALQNLAKRPFQINNTNYNYLIGGDGRVYEGRGNNWPADSSDDYANCFIKVAFLGQYSLNKTLDIVQEEVLNTLINYLKANNELKDDYRVLPQCCRNIPREAGPDNSIIEYLKTKYSKNWTARPCACINEIVSSTTTVAAFWLESIPPCLYE